MISSAAIPTVITAASLIMLFGKTDFFGAFITGAKEGFQNAVGLLPSLALLVVAVRMLCASGAVEFFARLLSPVCLLTGIPSEILPLVLTRPFSGGASLATYSTILGEYGADSYAGLCSSVIMGSSDTLVYVIGVYFSSVGIKRGRHTFFCAVIVMLFNLFFACFVCGFYFG